MTAEQIFATMSEVYASCSSYRDTGRVVTQYVYPPTARGRPDTVQEFTTAFVRPGGLRFESWWLHTNRRVFGRAVVWVEGGDAFLWQESHPGIQRKESLGWALIHAGRSVGRTIPGLLVPGEALGSWLADIVDVTLLGEELLDGLPCYRLRCGCGWWEHRPTRADKEVSSRLRGVYTALTGKAPRLGPVTRQPLSLWIDRQTLLLRRIEQEEQHAGYRTQAVTTYAAETGVPVQETELIAGVHDRPV